MRLLLCFLAACNFGNSSSTPAGDDTPIDAKTPGDGSVKGTVFDPTVTKVTVEVDYETGAEPFTGNIIGFGDTWSITTTNIDRLFSSKKTLAIPTTIGAMQSIGSVPDEALTVADMLALAQAHRQSKDTQTEKTYYVLFVTGNLSDDNGPNQGILGVSIGDTGVIVMFKDVIRSTSNLTNVQRFVEQSTMVHELGHAIGLVDNGVPLTSAHKDATHGAHCTNDACVMYWQNEGASAMTAWATQYVVTSSTILFKQDCLDDVDAR